MFTKEQFKTEFKNILKKNDFCDVIESTDLITPFFVDEFNLSAGHQFVLSALHNKEELPLENQAIIQWCIRKDDITRVGYTNKHLSSFEMAVFGGFGLIKQRQKTLYNLLSVFLDLMNRVSLDTKKIFFTISGGAQILDRYLPFDNDSYGVLKALGIRDQQIIPTKGRQNFVFSNGQDRASGYNIEIFYKYDDDYIEIASSNIYEFVLDNGKLIKTQNSGIGVGIGIERLLMIVNGLGSVYELLDIDRQRYEDLLGGKVQYEIAKSKIYRINELSKTISLIKKLVFDKNVELNSKQMKSYKYIKAKLDSEMNYLQIINK